MKTSTEVIKDILGEGVYNSFGWLPGRENFIDLKDKPYIDLSEDINEIIGFLQPLTFELYLCDGSEFYCEFKKKKYFKLAKKILVPDEADLKNNGYHRLWWDECQVANIYVLELMNTSLDVQVKALEYAKEWLVKYGQRVYWGGLTINVKQKNKKNKKNLLQSKLYGKSDSFDSVFEALFPDTKTEKAETINDIAFVYDKSDGDFSVTINGTPWCWITDDNIERFFEYGVNNTFLF